MLLPTIPCGRQLVAEAGGVTLSLSILDAGMFRVKLTKKEGKRA
jgi:hypothetical protein